MIQGRLIHKWCIEMIAHKENGKTVLKLKLQYFGHMLQRADSLEMTLMLGKIEGKRRRGQQRMRWLNSIIDSMDISLRKLYSNGQGSLVCGSPWGSKKSDTTEQLNWIELNWTEKGERCKKFRLVSIQQ